MLNKLKIKVDTLESKINTISLEDYEEQKDSLIQTNEEMNIILDTLELANEALYRIANSMDTDKQLLLNNKLSNETLQLSIETYNTELTILGLPNNNLSIENIDNVELSLEQLNGQRQSTLQNTIKYMNNLYHKFMDLYETMKAVYDKVKDYDTSRMAKYLKDLNEGKRVMSSTYRGNVDTLNEELAIFYITNHNFKVNDLKDYMLIPYNLIVKEKLYEDAFKFAYDILGKPDDVIGKLPTHTKSIEFLETIDMDIVKKYLNKDLKFGLIDRLYGKRFSIVSCYQDDEGADARHDFFTIDKNRYAGKGINAFDRKELEDLIEFGMELAGYGVDLYEASEKMYKENAIGHLKNNLVTLITELWSGNRSFREYIKRYFIVGRFVNGVYKALLMQNKSHLESGRIITKIAKNMTIQA